MSNQNDQTGPKIIQAYVQNLPNSPGVYRMMNQKGDVLYVGKAKKLKARVSNYTRIGIHSQRITRMISLTASMEFITTQTESEALLLEANLIKRLRPRYNVLLRDDKSFPYILIKTDHKAPMLTKHRGARKNKGHYFGPFTSPSSVYRTLKTLERAFLLRTCTDSVYDSRTRPCLKYQIKRCSAPCTGEISRENYDDLVKQSKAFLSGQSRAIQKKIQSQMQEASKTLDFENAAKYRDRLSALSQIQSHQEITLQNIQEADIFALYSKSGMSCIQVFFVRMGQNWGNHAYYPKADQSENEEAVLSAFISQFYDNKPLPKTIILSHKIEEQSLFEEAFSQKAEQKINIQTPQRGEKKELIAYALKNARDALARKTAEAKGQQDFLQGLTKAFELSKIPKRIEIYDNSHMMGTNAIGAMVVAGEEGFLKNQYRKYNIKFEETIAGDDYGMMREVMTRRFSKLIKEQGAKEIAKNTPLEESSDIIWPDLLLIDGGKGQLSVVHETLQKLGVNNVHLIAVAKGPERNAGRETFHQVGKQEISLPDRDPVLFYIQRLRDEAHRFAITSHRARRKKAMTKNPLDGIEGIGPARKKALLSTFGSAKYVQRASKKDLASVDGISTQMAEIIYNYFHEN